MISDLGDLKRAYDETLSPILLIDGGPEVNDTTAIVQTLLSQEELRQLPVVIVSRSAEIFEKTLSQHCSVAIGVRIPCTTTDVIAALTYIDDHYEDFVHEDKAPQRTTEVRKKEAPTQPVPQSKGGRDLVENFERREAEARSVALPYEMPPATQADKHFSEIFNNLSDLGLMSHPLGGRQLAIAMDESAFEDKAYFTIQDEKARQLTDQIAECTSQWDKGHIHRTSFLAWEISRSLGRPDSFVESTKEACLLYLAALLDLPQEYCRRDYFHPRYQAFRNDLSRRVKEIAYKVGVELDLPVAGKIIGKLSGFIAGEMEDRDDDIVLSAAIIQGVDLLGRSCARRGYFEPELAYDFLRRIRRGVYAKMNPIVLSCLVKVLAEAVVITALGLTIPKRKRNDPKLKSAASEYSEQKIGSHEMKVAIQSLTPGMRLSRPIQSFDGKIILSEDLVLDQDLIWRIWQLSAIRPLNAPLVVSQKKEVE